MKFFILISCFVLFGIGTYFIFVLWTPIESQPQTISPSIVEPQTREIATVKAVQWPIPGSAPTENVQYLVPLDEIKRGCARQDCIPSVDTPEFTTPDALENILDSESIGIALSYNGVNRFYPFPMLETHELVNDIVAGDPLLISYCPLCGTGIVFSRVIDGNEMEFGVSGMLWQSNLLMYNRSDSIEERNLWSQVLGMAVVGNKTGEKLTLIPSDIQKFATWKQEHPDGEVLTTGTPRNPYKGAYYSVAKRFEPNYQEDVSNLPPMTYVSGVEIDGIFKAYPTQSLPQGETTDVVNGVTLTIIKENDTVRIFSDDGEKQVPDIQGFWFSWVAAHPTTLLWEK